MNTSISASTSTLEQAQLSPTNMYISLSGITSPSFRQQYRSFSLDDPVFVSPILDNRNISPPPFFSDLDGSIQSYSSEHDFFESPNPSDAASPQATGNNEPTVITLDSSNSTDSAPSNSLNISGSISPRTRDAIVSALHDTPDTISTTVPSPISSRLRPRRQAAIRSQLRERNNRLLGNSFLGITQNDPIEFRIHRRTRFADTGIAPIDGVPLSRIQESDSYSISPERRRRRISGEDLHIVTCTASEKSLERKTRPLTQGQHCIICFDNDPMDAVGCLHCRQLIGCRACLMKWHATKNTCHLGRLSPLSEGISSVNHRMCPLCRAEWEFLPEVVSWDDLRLD